jgi:hypothetical protein
MKFRFLFLLLISFSLAYGQDEESKSEEQDKYLSIQSNQLIRQLLNFGGSSQAVSNPYLINFSLNNSLTGSGVSFGAGHSYSNFNDKFENGERDSNISSFSFRAGWDKKVTLNKRWMMAWGVDVLYDHEKNSTSNTSNFTNNSGLEFESIFKTNNTTQSMGIGPRFNFSYIINDWMMISTESTYYFKRGKTKSTLKSQSSNQEFDPNTNQFIVVEVSDETKDKSKQSGASIDLPVVINLVFKF